jgi:hypothetical protein
VCSSDLVPYINSYAILWDLGRCSIYKNNQEYLKINNHHRGSIIKNFKVIYQFLFGQKDWKKKWIREYDHINKFDIPKSADIYKADMIEYFSLFEEFKIKPDIMNVINQYTFINTNNLDDYIDRFYIDNGQIPMGDVTIYDSDILSNTIPNLKCSSAVRYWLDYFVHNKNSITNKEKEIILKTGTGVTELILNQCISYFNKNGENIKFLGEASYDETIPLYKYSSAVEFWLTNFVKNQNSITEEEIQIILNSKHRINRKILDQCISFFNKKGYNIKLNLKGGVNEDLVDTNFNIIKYFDKLQIRQKFFNSDMNKNIKLEPTELKTQIILKNNYLFENNYNYNSFIEEIIHLRPLFNFIIPQLFNNINIFTCDIECDVYYEKYIKYKKKYTDLKEQLKNIQDKTKIHITQVDDAPIKPVGPVIPDINQGPKSPYSPIKKPDNK